jgi:hypothetical protein
MEVKRSVLFNRVGSRDSWGSGIRRGGCYIVGGLAIQQTDLRCGWAESLKLVEGKGKKATLSLRPIAYNPATGDGKIQQSCPCPNYLQLYSCRLPSYLGSATR